MNNKYIKRKVEERVLKYIKQFPVVAVCGPRQAGKTTLLRKLLKKTHVFLSLDDIDKREEAIRDPKLFINKINRNCVIDEIQYAPNLLSYIKMAVDEKRTPGRFILTGSQQFLLMKGLSESLAGRVGIINLFPLSIIEPHSLLKVSTKEKFEIAAIKGLYPEVFVKDIDSNYWYDNYIKTYLERDIRDIYNIINILDFRNFIKITASRAAQLYNISSISSASKVPATTIKRWVSILEATGIIFILRPFHSNYSKQFIKMPKIYFYDTGLLCKIMGIKNKQQLEDSAFYGAIFENFCISEAIKILACKNREGDAYFIRTKKGLEADLLIKESEGVIITEFKAGMTGGINEINYLRLVENHIKPIKIKRLLLVNMDNNLLPPPGMPGVIGADMFFKMINEEITEY